MDCSKPMKDQDEINQKTLTYEREELMNQLTSDVIPTFRKSHFLNPSINPTNHVPHSFKPISIKSNLIKDITKTVLLKGRPKPLKGWKKWVENLEKTHHEKWKKAGIFDAIQASTCKIMRDNELIIEIAENWCCETNSFVFPWGEATISLEDVLILGGFSVMGVSVTSKCESVDEIIGEFINNWHKFKINSVTGPVKHYEWMDYFQGKGGKLEHVAFLVLWLARFVFSTNSYGVIMKRNFFMLINVALNLEMGIRIALGPAVLASIYKEMRLLKEKIVAFSLEGEDDGSELLLWASFQLVQVWVWERFPTLSPKPVGLVHGEPRIARWHNVSKVKGVNHRLNVASAEDLFLWKPYVLKVENWEFPKWYCDEGVRVLITSDVCLELLSFAMCLRACKLVGFDCVERYFPYRVGLQFGYDQDVPSSSLRLKAKSKLALSHYANSLDGYSLYVPPRLFEGDITLQYSKWWKPLLDLYNVKRKRNTKRTKKLSHILEGNVKDVGDEDNPLLCSLVRRKSKRADLIGGNEEASLDESQSCDDDKELQTEVSEKQPLLGFQDSGRCEAVDPEKEDKDRGLNGTDVSTLQEGGTVTTAQKAPSLPDHPFSEDMSLHPLGESKELQVKNSQSHEGASPSPSRVLHSSIGLEVSVSSENAVDNVIDKILEVSMGGMITGGVSKHWEGSSFGNESTRAVDERVMSEVELTGLQTANQRCTETDQSKSLEDINMIQAHNPVPDVDKQNNKINPLEQLEQLQSRISRLTRVFSKYKEAKYRCKD